tara:strand:- start:4165 stop:4335 length:171 start_codon:yes stop_codon:yes gene_type:complete
MVSVKGALNDIAVGTGFGILFLGGAALANISFSWVFGKTITQQVADFGIGDGTGVV